MTLLDQTVVRTTDIAVETVSQRIGNSGVAALDDFINKLDQKLGTPVELAVQGQPSLILSYTAANYSLPDGRRLSPFSPSTMPSLTAGTINFSAGTISSGTVSSFTIPSLTNNFFVKALIQYNIVLNALNVTFGTQAASQSAAGVPALISEYVPVGILELSINGSGAFNTVTSSNLVVLKSDSVSTAPVTEEQTSVGQTVFTLTQIEIPDNRDKVVVYVNGLKQRRGASKDYVVTDDTTVTFNSTVLEDAVVEFVLV